MKQQSTKFSAIVVCIAMACALSFTACQPNENVSQAQIDSLQTKLDSIMMAHNRMKSMVNEDFNDALASKDSTISAQASEIQDLLNQLHIAKKAQKNNAPTDQSGQIKEQQKQIKAQQKQLKESQTRVADLEKQLKKQQDELKKMQTVAQKPEAGNNADLARLQQQIRDQKNEIAKLNSQVESVSACDAALNQCQQDKAALNVTIATLQTQLEGMKKQLANVAQPGDDNAAEVMRLRGQVENLEAQLAVAEERADKANNTYTELCRIKADLSQCQTAQNGLRGQMESLKTELMMRDSTIAQLQRSTAVAGAVVGAQVATTIGAADKSADVQRQLADLQARYDEEKQRNEFLANESAKLQKAYNDQINKNEQAAAEMNAKVAALQNTIDALTTENSTLKDAAGAGADVAALQTEVARQQAELAKLQEELNVKDAALQAKEAELTALKKGGSAVTGNVNAKLQELQALCDGYVEEIARLKAENEALKAENASLRETNAQAQQVLSDNAELLKKVELASVLVMSDVQASAGKSISGIKMKEVTKASQVKMVRVGGTILANNVVTPGSITIYVRIANAANRVVCNGNPGDLTFDMNGIDMQYTTSQVIEFTGAARNINIVWRKFDNVTMEPGLYWATLYANGYEIGKTSFTLK